MQRPAARASLPSMTSRGLWRPGVFVLAGNSCTKIHAENMLDASGYIAREGGIRWCVMESPDAAMDVTGIRVSADGCVCSDHSF